MTTVTISDDRLECPVCHETFLHQGNISVHQRYEDENKPGFGIAADGGLIKPDLPNPSNRRGGFAIAFWCEFCHDWEGLNPPANQPAPLVLNIAQHKGETLVWWEVHSRP